MKKICLSSMLLFAFGLTVLSACGGGGGGGSTPQTGPKAVIKIISAGALGPGTKIGGISVTGILPSGVTVKATPDALNPSVMVTNSGVVVASGVTGTTISTLGTYNAVNRKVSIQVFDQAGVGFGTGEFVTVNCDITSGATPTAGGFGLVDYAAKDLNGADISGLIAGITVDIH